MTKRVIFTPEADDDVAQAYDWYEGQEPGLGEEFLRSVEAAIAAVQRHPLMYRIAVDEFRRALVRKFPFEVFYEVQDRLIVVYSVFHCSQDPGKWHARLRKG